MKSFLKKEKSFQYPEISVSLQPKNCFGMVFVSIGFENAFYDKLKLFSEANKVSVEEYVKKKFVEGYMVDMYGDLNKKVSEKNVEHEAKKEEKPEKVEEAKKPKEKKTTRKTKKETTKTNEPEPEKTNEKEEVKETKETETEKKAEKNIVVRHITLK